MKAFFSRLLLFIGFLCVTILALLFYQRYRPNSLAFRGQVGSTIVLSQNTDKSLPVRIRIPKASIDLPVFEASIHKKTWETSTKGATHLSSTPLPGEHGNSVFYGHNWPNLLGRLSSVQIGDTIEVFLKNGSKVFYTVQFVTIVSPDQTKILENSDDARLTIYTCTGFLDSKRFVVTALQN